MVAYTELFSSFLRRNQIKLNEPMSRHTTFGIVIKYMGTIFMVTDIQCTIQAEMIHKRIERILYHTLYVASVHINQFLPCGNKLHLSPGRCIIL